MTDRTGQGNRDCGQNTSSISGREKELAQNLAAVRQRIAVAGGADLLPVTKFHPVEDLEILRRCGVGGVGENREQEAKSKAEVMSQRGLAIHMIGQIQTKKANSVARWAAAVHTVDSVRLAEALDRGVRLAIERGDRAESLTESLPVLIQFSADGDPSRGGAVAEQIEEIADAVTAASNLELRGMMTVPPLGAQPAQVFARGRRLLDGISDRIIGTPVYSAGMSHDLEIAIGEGSTLVRVGTDIMGSRPVL